jgi:hypothetical protein
MTYTLLEEWVGDILLEPGVLPVGGWTRYSQTKRRRGITWAEMMAAEHLPLDKCKMLITTLAAVTIAADVITSPSGFMEVIDLYCATNEYHYEPLPAELVPFIHNANMDAGFYWRFNDSGNIKIFYPSGITYDPNTTPTKPTLIYKAQPHSYQTGTFGAAACPFVENESWIAIGAAGYVLNEGEESEKGAELVREFFAWLGIEDQNKKAKV